MQLGIGSYTYTWAIGVPGQPPPAAERMTALSLVERAARLGVRRVQIADNLPLDEMAPADLDALEQRASALEIAIEVGTRGIAPSHLLTYLGLARRFRSPILRVVVDRDPHHPGPDEVIDTIRGVIGEFEKSGVILAIENHDRYTAPTLARIIEKVGSRSAGICLDTVNSFGALEGPKVVLEVLGPLTVNLHVKDFAVVRASHMMGFSIEGRPAGRGQLDVPWLIETLREKGSDPSAILELWTPPEREISATIAKEHRWAVESVEYLRHHIPA